MMGGSGEQHGLRLTRGADRAQLIYFRPHKGPGLLRTSVYREPMEQVVPADPDIDVRDIKPIAVDVNASEILRELREHER